MTEKEKLTVFTRAHVPGELGAAWLQHLRDFDTAHPGCHFEVMVDGMNTPMAEMVEMLRVTPELSFSLMFNREKKE